MWRRMLLAILCSALLPLGGHSQAFSLSGWDSAERSLDDIERNWNLLRTDFLTLQTLLREQSERSAQERIRLQDLEDSLRRSEESTRRWRRCCLIGIPAAALLAGAAVLLIRR